MQAAGDQEVPDALDETTMVVTLAELDLDAVDLADDAPSFFEPPSLEPSELMRLLCTVYIIYFILSSPGLPSACTTSNAPEDTDMSVQGEFDIA